MSQFVSASLESLPLASVFRAYGIAVADLVQSLTSNYVTQLMALSLSVDQDGNFAEDVEGVIQARAVSFSGTSAEGKTYTISVPLIAFMSPPHTVTFSSCDLELIVSEVERESSQRDFSLQFGARISGKQPFSKIDYGASIKVNVAKVKKSDEARNTKATLLVRIETGQVTTPGNVLIQGLIDALNVVKEDVPPP